MQNCFLISGAERYKSKVMPKVLAKTTAVNFILIKRKEINNTNMMINEKKSCNFAWEWKEIWRLLCALGFLVGTSKSLTLSSSCRSCSWHTYSNALVFDAFVSILPYILFVCYRFSSVYAFLLYLFIDASLTNVCHKFICEVILQNHPLGTQLILKKSVYIFTILLYFSFIHHY